MDGHSEKFPIMLKFTIMGISMLDNIVMTLVYPILPFMVNHYLSSNANEKSISEYSGYLEGVYRLTQCFASIWISFLSDRLGKKKILIFTVSIHVFASVSLAFCTTYRQALINRLIAGSCSGTLPVLKSLMREITTDKNISEIYFFFALGVGLANIFGPIFAMTANPGKSLPIFFENIEFFTEYPYCLPLFLHGLLGLITLAAVVSILKEPKKNIEKIKHQFSEIVSNKLYLTTVLIFCLLAFAQYGFRLLFSLICKSPVTVGGIGLEYEYQVSLVQLCGGTLVAFFSPFLTTRLAQKFGFTHSLIYLFTMLAPTFVSLGICAWFSTYFRLLGLVFVFTLGNTCISVAVFYISICISNTVSPGTMTMANGVSEALVAIARFCGTSVFGVIYGWSVSDGLGIVGVDAKFSCFVVCVVPILCGVLVEFATDSRIEKKKESLEVKLMD